MTPKQRLLNSIKGKEVDRVPWSPFLAYFWEHQPKTIQEKGQKAFIEDIGGDPLFRGSFSLFTTKYKTCSINEKINSSEKIITYETPVGNLYTTYTYSPDGNTWYLTDHPVKTEEDFKILTYINEDKYLIPNMEHFNQAYKETGDTGLHLPCIGSESKSSFQSLLEHWVGTENLIYAMMDYPETVENCLHAMRENSVESVKISVQSPAEGFISWEDSSTTNLSPSLFEKYITPEINQWGNIIHDHNKLYILHACGHLKDLLPIMSKMDIDAIESISPPPTGNVELWDARKVLPEHIALIGGIEPTVFLNSTLEELESYTINLLQKMGNSRYVLANSDSCPPGVALEKFKLVSSIVKQNLHK